MALILLKGADIGQETDWLINTHWLVSAHKGQEQRTTKYTHLILTWAVPATTKPIDDAGPDFSMQQYGFICPDPDKVIDQIKRQG